MWPISTIQKFGWSKFICEFPTLPTAFSSLWKPFQLHRLQVISPSFSWSTAFFSSRARFNYLSNISLFFFIVWSTLFASSSYQRQPVVYLSNLSDSKSPQMPKNDLRILTEVCIVSILPQISNSSPLSSKPIKTIPSIFMSSNSLRYFCKVCQWNIPFPKSVCIYLLIHPFYDVTSLQEHT